MPSLRSKLGVWFIDVFVPAVFPRVNPAVRWLLKSPLHFVASWYVLLLCFEGRRSGRRYEVPVTFHRAADGAMEAVTNLDGLWWRNLRGNEGVSAVARGKERAVEVEVVVGDEAAVIRALASRDRCRRTLVAPPVDRTVLLRVHLAPATADKS